MIIDLLVHLETEDGALIEPEVLMEAAKSAGLDGMVLTRHNDVRPELAAYVEAAERENLKVFAGAALETNRGLILAIMPNGEDFDPSSVPLSEGGGGVFEAAGAIDAVEAQGGATIALRPYDRDVARPMGDHLFSLQGLDACEVMSGRASEIANDLALEAASNLEMPCVGTSGAHGTQGLGKAATLFRRAVADQTSLVEIIKRGDCWPIAFIEELPEEARLERTRGPRGGRPSHERRDRGGRRPERRDGAPRENTHRRSSGGSGGSAGPVRGRRGRGGRGGGRGRGIDRSTRVTSAPEYADRLPDDYGNRARSRHHVDAPDAPPDDIGNRLAPGERSPFHEVSYRDSKE